MRELSIEELGYLNGASWWRWVIAVATEVLWPKEMGDGTIDDDSDSDNDNDGGSSGGGS